ncbi:MAG: CHAT domain-containing protein, partial [Bacteroidota bacterium]
MKLEHQAPGGRSAILLHDLYLSLIAPFGELPASLIIIPDNRLHFLPFDALLTQAPDRLLIEQLGANFWKGQERIDGGASYLLHNHNVQYADAANLLYIPRIGSKPANQGLAAFAPVYGERDRFQGAVIPPLNGHDAHAKRLVEQMSGKAFLGTNADSVTFFQEVSSYSLLHLALHGYANETDPLKAALAFSSTAQSQGVIYAASLYGLPPISAELVSLLSCETGAGAYEQGEGIMSLARAFRCVGARSVLMSLWQADIGPGMEIIESFYHYLDEGLSKPQALRQAKLDWLSQADAIGAVPSKWANFVLTGVGDPLPPRPFRWGYIIIALITLGLI